MTEAVQAFSIDIPESQLDDLRERLARTRWPEPETCEGWDQGIPLAYTRELADYWLSDYDWRRCESRLNSWPQYMTHIDSIDIHFIHRRSPEPTARPLVISHGWPGSIIEFHKVIDALADPAAHGGDAADAFHVVAPSLPGYGFSGKPDGTGMSAEAIGRLWGKLMARLGYEQYFAQGGDWGSLITQCLAQSEVAHCAGVHVNMPIAAPDPDTLEDLSPQEQSALAALDHYSQWESGYSKQQSTRPQTLGYGLADSPVGQMAWIVEKFYAWTDCEQEGLRHPEHAVSRDELLDNVMIYWLNNCAASSARLYWESFNNPNLDPIDLPIGCSVFPREIMRTSERWARQRYRNLVYWHELNAGGHFAALEQPALFVDELRKCFRLMR
jgi:pimeloyl-ACP methyl ester carboxylesterase